MEVETIIIKTKGDKILDVALSKIGDKGLFTREIENELLAGNIDLAVHSLKDLPSILASGLILGGILKRENPQDVLISHKGYTISSLPQGARVGTSSLRRIAQLKALRPDLNMVDLRGNVETRIRKMADEDLDGIVLAYAGVKRLGFGKEISEMITPDMVLPAVGQGAVAVEIRANDFNTAEIVSAVNDSDSFKEALAERAFLATLEGGCQVPIACLARVNGQEINIEGLVISLDGQKVIRGKQAGDANKAGQLGKKLALTLLGKGAGTILDEIRR